jgi:thioredoxin 1
MRKWTVSAVVLLALCCLSCGDEPTAPSASAVVPLNSANFDQQVLGRNGVTMVEFYRPTCPHCQSMAPRVEQLAKEYSSRAMVGQVNTDVERTLPARYQIENVPTFVFFKNGQERSRIEGEMPYSTLTAQLDAAIAAP